jgi:hypothetical protein
MTGGQGMPGWFGSALGWARVAGVRFATIRDPSYAGRIVEIALKVQVAFLALLAVVAPFGGFGLTPLIGAGLVLQGALTWAVLELAWRRRLGLGRWLYCALAALTFVEAMRNTGIVGGIFGLEAMLSLVATWYIFVLHRMSRPQAPEPESETDTEEAP